MVVMAERVGPVISAWRGVLRPNLLPMPVSDDCQCLFALVHVRARGVLCNFRAQSQSFDGAMSLSFSFSSSSFPSATLRTICLFSPLAASHCQQQQQQWRRRRRRQRRQSSSFVTFCNLFTALQSDTRTPDLETRFGNGNSSSNGKSKSKSNGSSSRRSRVHSYSVISKRVRQLQPK